MFEKQFLLSQDQSYLASGKHYPHNAVMVMMPSSCLQQLTANSNAPGMTGGQQSKKKTGERVLVRVYVNTISRILPECSNHPGGHLKMFPPSATLVLIAEASVDPLLQLPHRQKHLLIFSDASTKVKGSWTADIHLRSFANSFTPGKHSCLLRG